MEVQVYAGIDVSKARLDLGLSGEPSVFSTLLVILNAMVKHQVPWSATWPNPA